MTVLISIGQVAKLFGVTTQTIRNWSREGKLSEQRTLGGHRRFEKVEVEKILGISNEQSKKTIIYSRVSSHEQKQDLKRQTEELEKHSKENQWIDIEVIEDIGSGINYNKKGLRKLINLVLSGEVARIVVSYKDRLVRFGSELLEQLCKNKGVEIVVLHEREKEDFQTQLVEDVLAILVVFCSKIYGRRSHEKRRKQKNEKAC